MQVPEAAPYAGGGRFATITIDLTSVGTALRSCFNSMVPTWLMPVASCATTSHGKSVTDRFSKRGSAKYRREKDVFGEA